MPRPRATGVPASWSMGTTASAVGGSQLWAGANRARYRWRVPPRTRLAVLAVVLAVIAAVLLAVAVVRRSGTVATDVPGDASGSVRPPIDGLGTPTRNSLLDAMVSAIYGAACRHEVGCGTGTLERCDYIVTTMRQMPAAFSVQRCPNLDEREARRCVTDLLAGPCANVAPTLEIGELQKIIARLPSCRHACE